MDREELQEYLEKNFQYVDYTWDGEYEDCIYATQWSDLSDFILSIADMDKLKKEIKKEIK